VPPRSSLESDVLNSLLPRLGYEVLWAANVTEAIRHLRFEPVDVLLCDLVRTPSLEKRLLTRLQRANPRVPMVLFSPVRSAQEERCAAVYGLLLYKPFSPFLLIDAIRHLTHPEPRTNRIRRAGPGSPAPSAARSISFTPIP
jgi:DNA-binding NtrC family response regulator